VTRFRRAYRNLFLIVARRGLTSRSAEFVRLWGAWGAWARRQHLVTRLLWRLS